MFFQRSFSFTLLIGVVLLSYAPYCIKHDLQNPRSRFLCPPQNDTEPNLSSKVPDECRKNRTRYILRFADYKISEEHRIYLEENMQLEGWDWIDRENPAANYPTDFAVISICVPLERVLIRKFTNLRLVKDAWPDRSYSRDLFEEKPQNSEAFINEKKRRGKIFTSMSFSVETRRRHLMIQKSHVTSLFGADALWNKGFTGSKVKMAIFDTGIRSDHPHFRNIKERTNWTSENTLNDNLGHGTFVAGVIAGQNAECPGFAPDAEIYAFRVFTDAQVWELTANNIIMVSAIGNDGPLYGTLNNPADQSDVIGVGGIDYNDHIASFSSRGMSTWEIPHGYGRVKPDIVAYGREIMGSKITTGCKSLSGTSVASPVVAGIVCLLVSTIPEADRRHILNPASMKQALVEGAAKLSGPNMFEQGAGRVDLLESYEILRRYEPRASIFPSVLDYTDCPYSWPFCRQPLYAGAMPVIFNATILNGMGVIGYIEGAPAWHPLNDDGNLLDVCFTFSEIIWPWTGYLALRIQVKEEGSRFSGDVEGNITLKVYSPAARGGNNIQAGICTLRLKLKVIPTPPHAKRILWDQFHSIKYPPGYIPRDSLDVRNDILDWHGDHLHTNFHIMFNMLRDSGYYIETLGSPLTCFDARQYGTLLMVDPEDEYFPEEIEKLKDDVMKHGLGLIVFAEWYNVDTMVKMRFFDDNTRSWWTPVTGGANIPALNDLLAPFGIAFGDRILNGDFTIDGVRSRYASGTNIAKFPQGGYAHSFPFLDSSESGATQNVMLASGMVMADSIILGSVEKGAGRIAVYGDSNCLDSSHMITNCYSLLRKMLDFTSMNVKDPTLFTDSVRLNEPVREDSNRLPSRRMDVNFSVYSSVVGKELLCELDSRFEVQGTKGYNLHVRGRNRRLPGYPVIDLGLGLNTTGDYLLSVQHGDMRGAHSVPVNWDLLYGDELERAVGITSVWLVMIATGLLLFLGARRIRQRRRRRRKTSTPGMGVL